MPDKTSKYLLSDATSLRRIKFAQFRRQFPSLLLLALALAMNAIFPVVKSTYIPLGLAVIAIIWYLFVGQSHRFRQRIAIPPENGLTSPIQGKIGFIRSNDDITLFNIHKVFIDSCELRSPQDACSLENNELHLDTLAGKIIFRFNFQHLTWFPDADFTTGNIIGMVTGNGDCTITFPGIPNLSFQAKDPIDAGEILIEDISGSVLSQKKERQTILEITPDMGDEDGL
jgi:hypothetical protein